MTRIRHVAAVLLASAAACSIYGSDDPDDPPSPPAPIIEAGADAPSESLDASGETAVVVNDDSGLDFSNLDGSIDAGVDQSAPLRDLYVFVTSKKISGRIDQLQPTSAADDFCNKLVLGTPKFAGRTFAAWLGVDNAPKDRIAKKAAGHRYLRVDDLLVTSDPTRMAQIGLDQPILITEQGFAIYPDDEVWTGVDNAGSQTGNTCGGWAFNTTADVGTVGLAGAIGKSWTLYGVDTCDQVHPIYCFEVP